MATSVRSAVAEPGWRPPTPPEARNYPYNCWWVAAFSDEVGASLMGRWLLDTPVLLYRTEAGRAVAIEDRCPHRGAPLSLGCRKGDAVQCGYHGFTFDSEGRCIDVPSLKAPLAAARVRSFPVVEHAPYVWIYLGDLGQLDGAPPPHRLAWSEDSSFALVHGRMDVDANYMLLKENVLDLTHFGYVHASTFKITDWVDPPSFSSDGETTSYRQVFTGSPLPPVFAEPLGLASGTRYDRENYGSFVSPALQIAAVDLKDPETGAITGRFRVSHATTPINGASMHYFWLLGRDHGTDPASMAALKAITEIGFAEDETMIEAIQATQNRDPRGAGATEISVKMDTAGIQARRIVQRWMERETR
jgi:phenylpropionate dioxygenase-like ring-hydroxylating dioxygenase large terminal subunit